MQKTDGIADQEMDTTLDKIRDLQNQYYSSNKKNFFFKNTQKLNCATAICDNIPIEDLISKTIYVIPDTNKVYLDYTIFKMFANPNNFNTIVEYIIKLFNDRINHYDDFQLHINLDSFTISALERYKVLIKQFCEKCLASNTRYSVKMDKVYIYNVPKSFDAIVTTLKPFIDPLVYGKLVLSKEN
jgi:hypothetical protein